MKVGVLEPKGRKGLRSPKGFPCLPNHRCPSWLVCLRSSRWALIPFTNAIYSSKRPPMCQTFHFRFEREPNGWDDTFFWEENTLQKIWYPYSNLSTFPDTQSNAVYGPRGYRRHSMRQEEHGVNMAWPVDPEDSLKLAFCPGSSLPSSGGFSCF